MSQEAMTDMLMICFKHIIRSSKVAAATAWIVHCSQDSKQPISDHQPSGTLTDLVYTWLSSWTDLGLPHSLPHTSYLGPTLLLLPAQSYVLGLGSLGAAAPAAVAPAAAACVGGGAGTAAVTPAADAHAAAVTPVAVRTGGGAGKAGACAAAVEAYRAAACAAAQLGLH
eukprot:1142711-Pelagomonas_calceolata.AAC.1